MAATRENKRIRIVVSQQGLNVSTGADLYPTQSQLITFGSYFKGETGPQGPPGPQGPQGEPGLGTLQTLLLDGNSLSISEGNTVKLPQHAFIEYTNDEENNE